MDPNTLNFSNTPSEVPNSWPEGEGVWDLRGGVWKIEGCLYQPPQGLANTPSVVPKRWEFGDHRGSVWETAVFDGKFNEGFARVKFVTYPPEVSVCTGEYWINTPTATQTCKKFLTFLEPSRALNIFFENAGFWTLWISWWIVWNLPKTCNIHYTIYTNNKFIGYPECGWKKQCMENKVCVNDGTFGKQADTINCLINIFESSKQILNPCLTLWDTGFWPTD